MTGHMQGATDGAGQLISAAPRSRRASTPTLTLPLSGGGDDGAATSPPPLARGRIAKPGAKRPGAAEAGVEAEFSRTKAITARARKLRVFATDAERKLWSALRGAQIEGASFRRQHPVAEYYLDFWCSDARLTIELDGGQHGFQQQTARDAVRSKVLESRGITVLRFWNDDVLSNTDGVLEVIAAALRSRRASTPTLTLPLSGGGDDGMPSVPTSKTDHAAPPPPHARGRIAKLGAKRPSAAEVGVGAEFSPVANGEASAKGAHP